MDAIKTDYLNIGLIILSFVLAIKLPFELFLFSYAVLGPLHYLTEINWLEEKQFYTKKKLDFLPLTILCLIASVGFMMYHFTNMDGTRNFANSIINTPLNKPITWIQNNYSLLIFLSFVSSLAFVFFDDIKKRVGTIAVGIIIAFLAHNTKAFYNIFSVFLPTIIHVSLFTGLFMLYGALKAKNTSGYIATAVFFLFSILFIFIDVPYKEIAELTKINFNKSSFSIVSSSLANVFSATKDGETFGLASPLGLKIQAFVAFAYTYHYLNWFSKTKIIEWHKTSSNRLITIIILWVFSVLLYWWDYRIGLVGLFFLSLLHVFLEFPLNVISIKGIFGYFFIKK